MSEQSDGDEPQLRTRCVTIPRAHGSRPNRDALATQRNERSDAVRE